MKECFSYGSLITVVIGCIVLIGGVIHTNQLIGTIGAGMMLFGIGINVICFITSKTKEL